MAFQATKQREGGPLENLGPANASIQNCFRLVLDDAIAEFNAWFAGQAGKAGANMNMIVRDPVDDFTADFSIKGDFADRGSFRGFLSGQVVDPVNEIESNVEYTVAVGGQTKIDKYTERDDQTSQLNGNQNTSAKVVDAMVSDMADEFESQLIEFGPPSPDPTKFTAELQTVVNNQIDYGIIEV